MTKHGHCTGKATPTYRSWDHMVQRCTNPDNHKWRRYGGRGITVCKRWLVFSNFLADMGERPAGRTLDRRNNDKGYCKSNCRWATPREQQMHKRNPTLYYYGGYKDTIVGHAERLGISRQCMRNRMVRLFSKQ